MCTKAPALAAFMILTTPLCVAAQESEEAAGRPAPGETGADCIAADEIKGYHTVSDELIRFELKDHDVMARLRKNCPQLHFHGYISYQPVNGMLCAKFDDVVSRSGMPCRIASFTALDHRPGDENADDSTENN